MIYGLDLLGTGRRLELDMPPDGIATYDNSDDNINDMYKRLHCDLYYSRPSYDFVLSNDNTYDMYYYDDTQPPTPSTYDPCPCHMYNRYSTMH